MIAQNRSGCEIATASGVLDGGKTPPPPFTWRGGEHTLRYDAMEWLKETLAKAEAVEKYLTAEWQRADTNARLANAACESAHFKMVHARQLVIALRVAIEDAGQKGGGE